ncbi:MAG: hypothetical protein JWO95_1267, partial [Verrucomicrobiales bacterium]|nr:hypothetical protein [Verrucomicrobiales bacterium]
MYSEILHDGCRYGEKFFTNTAANPRIGRYYTGASGEQGIRPMCGMVLANAALLKYSDVLTKGERDEYKSKTLATLRYLTSTHVTGTQKCPDGKHWGDHWQSAFWDSTATFGVWLIWDDLDPQLQKDVERVIAHESDRFLNTKPPGGSFNDTKAEENGWNLTCIAMAVNMFPKHSHHAAWHQKAIEYMMNTLSDPQDATDNTLVDGRPVREWFSGANVHSDFTLENHGFFHPSYIACSSYFLTQTAMYYTYAHQSVPQAANHHLMDTWRLYQNFILPNGEAAYPQGMDWEFHNLPYLNLFASLATYKKDPLAAHAEAQVLQYFRAWQEMTGDGSLTFPGSKLGFVRHACTIDQITWAFLAHKIFGPATSDIAAQSAESAVDGIHTYNDVAIITHRTGKKFVSFSLTNYVMGMLIPIGAGHETNPDFTAPIRDGFIGSFDTGAKPTKPVVTAHFWKTNSNGFETFADLLLNSGQLKQTVHVTSIGQQTVVYEDHVTAVRDVTIKQEQGIPLGIENDQITGGTRTIAYEGGSKTFAQASPQTPANLAGSWANVEGRVGLIVMSGSGILYKQAHGYSPGISICQDVLYGSYSDHPANLKAGEEV